MLAFLTYLRNKKVTSLEPRTLHQSAKLRNVPKNECLFTPFINAVNENYASITPMKSMNCTLSTAK